MQGGDAAQTTAVRSSALAAATPAARSTGARNRPWAVVAYVRESAFLPLVAAHGLHCAGTTWRTACLPRGLALGSCRHLFLRVSAFEPGNDYEQLIKYKRVASRNLLVGDVLMVKVRVRIHGDPSPEHH